MGYKIPVNDFITIETSLVHENSQFYSFLVFTQDRVIKLRCTRLNPNFFQVLLLVVLYFLYLYITYSLIPMVRYRFCLGLGSNRSIPCIISYAKG